MEEQHYDPIVNDLLHLINMDHPEQLAKFNKHLQDLKSKHIGFNIFPNKSQFLADVTVLVKRVLQIATHYVDNEPNAKSLQFGVLVSIFTTTINMAKAHGNIDDRLINNGTTV